MVPWLSSPLRTLLFCMSLLAPFFRSTTAASTLFTAAAQCKADLPGEEARREVRPDQVLAAVLSSWAIAWAYLGHPQH